MLQRAVCVARFLPVLQPAPASMQRTRERPLAAAKLQQIQNVSMPEERFSKAETFSEREQRSHLEETCTIDDECTCIVLNHSWLDCEQQEGWSL